MARARKAPASGSSKSSGSRGRSSGSSSSSRSSSGGRSRSAATQAKQAAGRTASQAKQAAGRTASQAKQAAGRAGTQAKRTTKSAASRATSAARSRASTGSSRGGGSSSSGQPTKDQLVERIGSYARRLKRDELASLVERLENGTLRLGDLALSGEGGFGFQEELRSSASDRARSAAKDGEDLVERGGSAGRGLLEKAKSAVGK